MPPAPRSSAVRLAVVGLPLALCTSALALAPFGCGSSKHDAKGPAGGSSSTTVVVSKTDAGPTTAEAGAWTSPDAEVVAAADAIPMSTADAAPAVDAADAGPQPPCWKGFATTGNDVADLQELGKRCCAGMSPLVGPVKQALKQGEVKTIPAPFVPGCYRIIAVGGTGLKDVDLVLSDQTGKEVAADKTPNDTFPMIHPNKEFCVDALQILNLSIIVKKGSGEVAGEVWKR